MASEYNKKRNEAASKSKSGQIWLRYIIIAVALIGFLLYLKNFSDFDRPYTFGSGYTDTQTAEEASETPSAETAAIAKDGGYTSKEDVALYIHTYGVLPDNFITKDEAKALGWDASSGNLAEVAPGKSIGGDRFGNYEGLLPDADGRTWTECDVGYVSGARGGERIVFSSDGLVYYSADHYESFEPLYGEEAQAA